MNADPNGNGRCANRTNLENTVADTWGHSAIITGTLERYQHSLTLLRSVERPRLEWHRVRVIATGARIREPKKFRHLIPSVVRGKSWNDEVFFEHRHIDVFALLGEPGVWSYE